MQPAAPQMDNRVIFLDRITLLSIFVRSNISIISNIHFLIQIRRYSNITFLGTSSFLFHNGTSALHYTQRYKLFLDQSS